MTSVAEAKIRELLDTCCDVDTSHILIAEQDGYVILEGHVSSYPSIFKVTESFQSSADILVLLNHLTVRLPGERGREDTDIARDIAVAVNADLTIRASGFRYSVRHGVVAISGTAPDVAQVQRAEHLLADISGLEGIVNQVRIES